jgi:hypothetical protein
VPDLRLGVVIEGARLANGGVNMERGTVHLGVPGAPNLFRGTVVTLRGTDVVASLRAVNDSTVALTMHFTVDGASKTVAGTVSARPGGSDGD